MLAGMKLRRWDVERDGPLTEQALRERLEQEGYRVSRYLYPPGTYFPAHTHAVDKIDAVLAGRFRIEMEGESVVLEVGDSVHVPRGAEHSAEVIGNETVISLDAVRAR
jgi:quercetin dioxygenase-like cupin family protein